MHRDFAMNNGVNVQMQSTTNGNVHVVITDVDGQNIAQQDFAVTQYKTDVDDVCDHVTGP